MRTQTYNFLLISTIKQTSEFPRCKMLVLHDSSHHSHVVIGGGEAVLF